MMINRELDVCIPLEAEIVNGRRKLYNKFSDLVIHF